jgi:hypothetical protein
MFPCDSLRLQGLSPNVAKDSDQLAGALDTDNPEGLLAGLFADEDEFDRRALWRIGSWGAVTVGAIALAVYANQTSLGWRREQVAAADLTRQAQQIQQLAREGQVETRKLASAVDTLNGDRDRLYSRVTVLEQGLDSVTGAIAKQAAAPPPVAKPVVASSAPDVQPPQPNPAASPAPVAGPVATAAAAVAPTAAAAPTAVLEKPRAEAAKPERPVAVTSTIPAPPAATQPPAPLVAAKSMMGPPDPAAPKLIEAPKPASAVPTAAPVASVDSPKPDALASIPAAEPMAEETEAPKAAVQRTEFAVDLGSANSVGGLRTLWRGIVASNTALKALNPIIMVRESKTGHSMQLRLAAGPLQDAATAAKICAAIAESRRGCETTVFDGQRLTMAAGEVQPLPAPTSEPPALRPASTKRGWPKHGKDDPPVKPEASTISSWFSGKGLK